MHPIIVPPIFGFSLAQWGQRFSGNFALLAAMAWIISANRSLDRKPRTGFLSRLASRIAKTAAGWNAIAAVLAGLSAFAQGVVSLTVMN
jgi:hypothetical protein